VTVSAHLLLLLLRLIYDSCDAALSLHAVAFYDSAMDRSVSWSAMSDAYRSMCWLAATATPPQSHYDANIYRRAVVVIQIECDRA